MSDSVFTKEWVCNICEQKCKTDHDLKAHCEVHTSEYYEKHVISKNHACHTCKNNFLCEKELQDHLMSAKCKEKIVSQVERSETLSQKDDSVSMSATKVDDSEEVLVITPENCNITNVYIFTDDSEAIIDPNILQSIDIDTIEQAKCTEITVFVIPPGSSLESTIFEADLNDENTKQNKDNDSCMQLNSDILDSHNVSSSIEKQVSIKKTKPSFKKQQQSHDAKSSLQSAPNVVTKPRVFKCMDCGKCYNHRLSLKSHQRNKHGSKKPYECFICERSFALRKYLRKHIFTHSEDKPYQCKSCFKGFIRKDEFEIHMMIHRGETPPSKCMHCAKVCLSMSNLRNHILHHHQNPESYRHNCTVCDKKFAANYLLQRHIKTHSNTTNKVLCSTCGLGFKSQKIMKIHMLSHSIKQVEEC